MYVQSVQLWLSDLRSAVADPERVDRMLAVVLTAGAELAIWLGGEELHNNHHHDPHSAKFKAKWYEFDIGWVYIRLLAAFKLAKVKYARA